MKNVESCGRNLPVDVREQVELQHVEEGGALPADRRVQTLLHELRQDRRRRLPRQPVPQHEREETGVVERAERGLVGGVVRHVGRHELEVRLELVGGLRRHLDRPGIGQHPPVEGLPILHVHRAADPDLAAGGGDDVPHVRGGELVAVSEVVDPVLAVGHARVNRDPLDPGFQIRLVLVGRRGVDLGLPIEPLEARELPLGDELVHQPRNELVELEQNQPTLPHDRDFAAPVAKGQGEGSRAPCFRALTRMM